MAAPKAGLVVRHSRHRAWDLVTLRDSAKG